jgi:hypothetical protein
MELRIQQLEQELNDLKQKIKHLQYIDSNPNFIKVSERLVDLGYVTKAQFKEIMSKQQAVILSTGQTIEVNNPKRNLFNSHLKNISKSLSKKKLITDGFSPKLRKADRANLYTYSDYTRYGDNTIHTYMRQHPFHTWMK